MTAYSGFHLTAEIHNLSSFFRVIVTVLDNVESGAYHATVRKLVTCLYCRAARPERKRSLVMRLEYRISRNPTGDSTKIASQAGRSLNPIIIRPRHPREFSSQSSLRPQFRLKSIAPRRIQQACHSRNCTQQAGFCDL